MTLLEVVVSMTVFAMIMVMVSTMMSNALKLWSRGEAQVENFQSGRGALELMEREMKPALANSRVQFAVTKSDILGSGNLGLENLVAPNSQSVFFASPIGESSDLVLAGYYLFRDDSNKHYWLRRLYLNQTKLDASGSSPFPNLVSDGLFRNAQNSDGKLSPHQQYANWFFTNLETRHFNDHASGFDSQDICVSTLATGVIALWIQAFDQQGNAIVSLIDHPGHHPAQQQPVIYNSAAYFVQANTGAFDDGSTSTYTGINLAPDNTPMAYRASVVPSFVEMTMVALSTSSINRSDASTIPSQPNLFTTGPNGTVLDVKASVAQLSQGLIDLNINDYRVFMKRVKLLNGGR